MMPTVAHEHNTSQQHYFDHDITDPEFEVVRPRTGGRFYTFLMTFKVDAVLRLLGSDLRGASVLHVCGGSGMDAEIVARRGARVTCTDVSIGALQRAAERGRRFDVRYDLAAADAEHLPFADGSFDYAFVHDGLHHLIAPEQALREMVRVSRVGVMVTEPADAALTGLAIRLGLIQEREEAGNEVYRFQPARLERCFTALGRPNVRYRRYLLKYPHQPGPLFRVLDRPIVYQVAHALFMAIGGRLLGQIGNKLAIVALASDHPQGTPA